jgi:hypothetical protein
MTKATLQTNWQWAQKCIAAAISELGNFEFDVKVDLNYKAGISKAKAVEAAKVLWTRIDRQCTNTKKQQIMRVCMLEGESKGGNWHYHCVAKAQGMTAQQLILLIESEWSTINESGRYSKFELIDQSREQRLLRYILKDWGHDSLCEATTTALGSI